MKIKRVVISLVCILVGCLISWISAIWSFMPELINFIGAVFIMGAFIYLEGAAVAEAKRKGSNRTGWYLVRRLSFLVIGVILLLVPVSLHIHEIPLRIAKAFGEAFLVTALWEFFSYTTITREETEWKTK